MNTRRSLSILAAGLAAAGLQAPALGGFVTVPVQPAGSQALLPINPKINLDTPTETQNRANTLGTVTGANIGAALPAGTILKASRTAPIVVNGVTVGTLHDRVWCLGSGSTCNATNTYTLGLRVQLNTNVWNPSGQSFEVNDLFRAIRASVAAEVAYYRGVVNPLPTSAPAIPPFPATTPSPGSDPNTASAYKDLEVVGRTLQGLFEPSGSAQYAAKTTNNAWINFRADVNKADPDINPPWSYNSEWSPWLLVRQVCPSGYNATPQALKARLWQGGEEGQTPQAILTSAYVCN
ncbi:hypothetical protein [Aquabacterium sp. OR-4]|uniref:hypothetical protein n=1 Tax=Aquabacterium sp. OR-4 TaxID=2978127 RepID=UPI0021B286E8|nr:hypothetical protein [Aquabacterium sp. OR-4]MDT7838410.1 hypothetical protein [Aquabacterium sp. OR-4]